jgi:tetratricopeptide (TPR) repeat protein
MKSVLTLALQKAGVKMLAGTDADGFGTLAGFSLVDELQELHESGLTNYEALQTATVYPALFVHQDTAFGKVQNGFRADLILVNSNPLEDLSSLRKLAGVFVNGKWLSESELAQMKQSLATRFEEQVETGLRLLESGKTDEAQRFLAFNDPYERMGSYLLQSVLEKDSFQQLTALVQKLRATNPLSSLTSEAAINSLGYALLGKKQLDKATQVLIWNAKAFPSSANAQDSLADAYIAQKDILSAIGAYKRALEIDPAYGNAELARRYLTKHRELSEK